MEDNKRSKLMKLRNAYTHSGKFHADDVFASALMKLIVPDITIHRVSSLPAEYNDTEALAFDIEGGDFDHHNEKKKARDNGIQYASFGLLWKEFSQKLGLTDKSILKIDHDLVSKLDASDNGGIPDALSLVIASFNPVWDSDESSNKAFEKAVSFACEILERFIMREKAAERAEEEVKAALDESDGKIVVLERFAPWENVLVESSAIYVIYPSMRESGTFNVQGVPVSLRDRKVRCPFPEKWRGVSEEKLSAVSGIPGLRFCHKNGFIITCADKKSAIQAAKISLVDL